MRHFTMMLLCISFFSGIAIAAPQKTNIVDVYTKPEGEYATIDTRKSMKAMEVLMGKGPESKKDVVAKEIESTPGEYNPPALIALSSYYFNKKKFEEAAFFFRAGFFRAVIDIEAANDPSLEDSLFILTNVIRESTKNHSVAEREKTKQAIFEATKKIIVWDKNIPRSYDTRWACLHSMRVHLGEKKTNFASPEKYQSIIEKHRKAFIKSSKKRGITDD